MSFPRPLVLNKIRGSHYVTDTMALVLWLEKRKLPTRLKEIFEKAERGETVIYIPAMVFAEIGYLSEKKRIDITLRDVDTQLVHFKSFKEAPLTFKTVLCDIKV